uniref:Uncharacterized protein n=1 Tax=Anguilla anguilla TaxID=7936 RepID=A0A0E9ST89_ANGAN
MLLFECVIKEYMGKKGYIIVYTVSVVHRIFLLHLTNEISVQRVFWPSLHLNYKENNNNVHPTLYSHQPPTIPHNVLP